MRVRRVRKRIERWVLVFAGKVFGGMFVSKREARAYLNKHDCEGVWEIIKLIER